MNDEDLLRRIEEIDDELIEEGVEPCQRQLAVEGRLAKELRISYQINSGSNQPHHVHMLREFYDTYYREEDFYMPPAYVGSFLYRDIFFPVRIPRIFGSPPIAPATFLGNTKPSQRAKIFGEKDLAVPFFDQTMDLFDFVYGLDDAWKMERLPDKTVEMWHLAKQQLEAAAAVTLVSLSKDAVVQNCCVAVELLLKGALIASGTDPGLMNNSRLGYGHNLLSLAEKACESIPGIQKSLLLDTIGGFPDYVHTRYNYTRLSRVKLGRLLMNSQFIAGEILRQFSERNLRNDFVAGGYQHERLYPMFILSA